MNSSSRVSFQYHSVILILILIGFREILAHMNLISIRKYIKGMVKNNIQIHLKCVWFQSSMEKCGGNEVSH